MIAARQLLNELRRREITIVIQGEKLGLTASKAPPERLVQALKEQRDELAFLLTPDRSGWTPEDWRAYFEERAGVRQFEGGAERAEAEHLAFQDCVTEWLTRNPEGNKPTTCAACGLDDKANEPLVPFGGYPFGHSWLHHACWQPWYEERKQKAKSFLMRALTMQIT
jgi:hypothetical protein